MMLKFIFIAGVVTFVLLYGILIGYSINQDDVSALTEKTQEQFFEIQYLKGQFEVCKYNAGVTNEIVLSHYVVRN